MSPTSIDFLLYTIKQHGIEKALKMVDIETIEEGTGNTIKVICRTIKYSIDKLEEELLDAIFQRQVKELTEESKPKYVAMEVESTPPLPPQSSA